MRLSNGLFCLCRWASYAAGRLCTKYAAGMASRQAAKRLPQRHKGRLVWSLIVLLTEPWNPFSIRGRSSYGCAHEILNLNLTITRRSLASTTFYQTALVFMWNAPVLPLFIVVLLFTVHMTDDYESLESNNKYNYRCNQQLRTDTLILSSLQLTAQQWNPNSAAPNILSLPKLPRLACIRNLSVFV